MHQSTPKFKALALGAVALPVLIVAGCGGGSSKSSSGFVTAANNACAAGSTTTGSVYETVGERYKPGTRPWAAGAAAGKAVAVNQLHTTLQGVKPSSGQAANYKTYLSMLQQERTLLLQEEATVKSGDQATYGSLDSRRTSLTNSSDRLAQRMGLSVCANRGITNADKAQITQLAASAKTNSPSQCTQDMTPAFVKQEFGSMAACITNGKQPVGPSNAKSVDISNIAGAGDFATGDVVLHLRSGHTQNLSAAFFRQHGSWRLLGLQNR